MEEEEGEEEVKMRRLGWLMPVARTRAWQIWAVSIYA